MITGSDQEYQDGHHDLDSDNLKPARVIVHQKEDARRNHCGCGHTEGSLGCLPKAEDAREAGYGSDIMD